MPGGIVFVSNAEPCIQVKMHEATNTVVEIVVNPETFVDAIVGEFRGHVARLRDPGHPEHAGLRRHFEEAWHLVHKRS
jgi:hypothetical protein